MFKIIKLLILAVIIVVVYSAVSWKIFKKSTILSVGKNCMPTITPSYPEITPDKAGNVKDENILESVSRDIKEKREIFFGSYCATY